MSELREEYKRQTGKNDLYKIDSADYHTLRYVQWLEQRDKEREWGMQELIDDLNDLKLLLANELNNI